MSHIPFPWHEPFLTALREYPVTQWACDAVGISSSVAYRARKADPDFAAAWDAALEAGIDRAEKEAFARAVDGWQEPVFYRGGVVGHVLKKSDAMLALVLKGRRKAVYAERTELTGANGDPLTPTDETARAARLAALMALAQARKDADDIA